MHLLLQAALLNSYCRLLPIEYVKSCFVRTSVPKFELWTDWCSWQLSMVNHQAGNKGSKDTNATLLFHWFIHMLPLIWSSDKQACRAAAFLLSLLTFLDVRTHNILCGAPVPKHGDNWGDNPTDGDGGAIATVWSSTMWKHIQSRPHIFESVSNI